MVAYIDWKLSDELMFKVFDFLIEYGNKQLADKIYYDWYLKGRKFAKLPIDSEITKEWISDGIDYITDALLFFREKYNEIDERIGEISEKSRIFENVLVATINLREKLKELIEAQKDLLGCFKGIGNWFVGLLQSLTTTYPNDKKLREAYAIFQDYCFALSRTSYGLSGHFVPVIKK